jgi:hypothetical protein
MSHKQPITTQRGTFVCTIYDVSNLMELPLANIRKLWKIMLSADYENRETIQMIRDWLPANIESTEKCALELQGSLQQAAQDAERLRREVEVFGSVATKEQKAAYAAARRKLRTVEKMVKAAKAAHVKAQKLQTIFTSMTNI